MLMHNLPQKESGLTPESTEERIVLYVIIQSPQ